VTAHRLTALAGLVLLAGALSSVPARSASAQGAPEQGRSLRRRQAVSAVTTGALPAGDAAAIARRWGVEIVAVRLASQGYMLEFRYKILDATKAQPLFAKGLRPTLRDEASGIEAAVPNPPTTGALRNTYDAKAGRTYFMFFGNPSRLVAVGSVVTVTVGDFCVTGVRVTSDAEPAAKGETE
jgi:hypothetical protein